MLPLPLCAMSTPGPLRELILHWLKMDATARGVRCRGADCIFDCGEQRSITLRPRVTRRAAAASQQAPRAPDIDAGLALCALGGFGGHAHVAGRAGGVPVRRTTCAGFHQCNASVSRRRCGGLIICSTTPLHLMRSPSFCSRCRRFIYAAAYASYMYTCIRMPASRAACIRTAVT